MGGLLLAAASFFLWQWRFERVGTPQNASFADGTTGWKTPAEGVVLEKEGSSTTIHLTRPSSGPPPELVRQLDAEGQRYVWIRCEVAARELQAGREGWQCGRVACFGFDHAGRGLFNREHALAALKGTQPWRKAEMIFELDPRMQQVFVSLYNGGESGEFAVRNFDLAFVKDRGALTWLVPLLLLGWVSWLVLVMRSGLHASTPVWRCAMAALGPLTIFWFMGLPGSSTAAHPLAARPFLGPQYATAPVLMQPAAKPAQTQPSVPEATPAPGPGTPSAVAVPIPRHRPVFEWVNHNWHALYLVIFFGLTLPLLMLAGTQTVWPISFALLLLLQGVEWLEYGRLDWDDLGEVLWGAGGIFLALWLWRRLKRLQYFQKLDRLLGHSAP